MASLSHDLPTSAGLEEATKRIIKQHQRDCENAGEFREARAARAALQELQHQSELEGLCRLFCRHYIQLSGVEEAYEKHLRTLDESWRTQQLPELVEKVRRWRQQLQERQEEELATIAPSKTEEDCTVLRPRFKKEAFDVQRKVLFLGHQGRYDEAEELQKKLALRQRMDAAEHKAVLKARRERQTQRLLTAQAAERQSLETKVERLVSYHNRQNAEAIDVLRRKYLGQRRSLVHNQALETQKYLHALKSFTPNEAIRMASSVLNAQWKVKGSAVQGPTSSESDTSRTRSNNFLRFVLEGEGKESNYETAGSFRKGASKQVQTVEILWSEDASQTAKVHSSNSGLETMTTEQKMQGETRKKRGKALSQSQRVPPSRSDTLSTRFRGNSTCFRRLVAPLRDSLRTGPPRFSHSTQNLRSSKSHIVNRHITDGSGERGCQVRAPNHYQEASTRRSSDQLQGSARNSQLKRLTRKSVAGARSTEKEKLQQTDALRDEIFEAWKECAAKVTNEQATADTLR